MPTLTDKYAIELQQVCNIDMIRELVQQTQELVMNLSNSNQMKANNSQSHSLNQFLQKNLILSTTECPTVKNTSCE